MSGYFITGTDTEIGKTRIALGLMAALQARNHKVLGMKPVAAGCVMTKAGLRNEDALQLQAAGSSSVAYSLLNPYAYLPAIAPHIAAEEAGVPIVLDTLCQHYQQLAQQADIVVVEGAGGWAVPLGPSLMWAEVVKALQLPVILVVGIRLGCLNHALLSVASIRQSGLRLLGWVANSVTPQMAREKDNITALCQRIEAPCLGRLAFQASASPIAVAGQLSLADLF